MNIGKRIYFEKAKGTVLVDIGERSGDVVVTTEEQDRINFPILELFTGEYDSIQLQYGELGESFSICKAYKINPSTKEIEFLF
ncbi:MAG: hypothetical protein ACM3TR_11445 [Caulobacteraceae bacterium]